MDVSQRQLLEITSNSFLLLGFISDHCINNSSSVGPSWGEVLRFHSQQAQDAWYIPTSDLDCWITLEGHQAAAGTPQRYATLQWRSSYFSLEGYQSNGTQNCSCANANTHSSTIIKCFEWTSSCWMTKPAACYESIRRLWSMCGISRVACSHVCESNRTKSLISFSKRIRF